MNLAAYTAEIAFPNHRTKEWFKGKSFMISNASLGDLLRVDIGTINRIMLTSENAGGVTITNAAARTWRIDPQVIDWAPQEYFLLFQFTFTGGVVKTYLCTHWLITR